MLNKVFKFLTVLFASVSMAHAGDVWLPATIIVKPDGSFAQHIPIPVDGQPAPNAVGGLSDFGFAGAFPVVGGNVTRFSRIFALEELNDQPDVVQNLRPASQGGSEVILPTNNPRGYKVIRQGDESLTLGGAITFGPGGFLAVNATLAAGATVGRGFLTSLTATSLAKANQLANPKVFQPKIPASAEFLMKNYQPGDSISFKRNIDLWMNMSAGAGWLINFGIGGSINTNWNTTIGRLSNFQGQDVRKKPVVKVSYEKGRDKSISASIGNLFTGFSVAKIWGNSNTITYVFDLSNDNQKDISIKYDPNAPRFKKLNQKLLGNFRDTVVKGFRGGKMKELDYKGATAKQAYLLALKGDLTVADLLAADEKSQNKNNPYYKIGPYGVTKISEERSRSTASNFSATLKAPWIINATWSSGKSYVLNDLKQLDEDRIVETYNGVYSKNFSTSGIASRDASRSSVFTGFIQVISNLDEGPAPSSAARYAANWKYSYTRNKVDGEKIQDEIAVVRKKLGFQKRLSDLSRHIPAGKNKSFEIEVDVLLSNMATEALTDIARTIGEKAMVNEAVAYLKGFAEEYGQKKYYDENGHSIAKRELCSGGAGPRARILAECINTAKLQIQSAMKKAIRALKIMDQYTIEDPRDPRAPRKLVFNHSQRKDFESFVTAYADFGEGFIENRFVMKTFLRMLRFDCSQDTVMKGAGMKDFNEKLTFLQSRCKQRLIDKKPVPYKIDLKVTGTGIQPFTENLYGAQFKID